MKLNNRWSNHYAQLIELGIIIGLHPSRNDNVTNNSANLPIGFTTDDFEETKSFLEILQIDIKERNEEGGTFLHFNDPDGTAIYFIKPKW